MAFAISVRAGGNLRPKCQVCKKEINKENCYKVPKKNGGFFYYCSETEYLKMIGKKNTYDNVKKKIEDIIGVTINSTINKEISIWNTVADFNTIYDYLCQNEDFLYKTIHNKSFDTEYGKIRYFSAIVKNNIKDFKEKEVKEEPVKSFDVEIYEVKFKPKKRRKCLTDYEGGD